MTISNPVQIHSAAYSKMIAICTAAWPLEACGILSGPPNENSPSDIIINNAAIIPNISPMPTSRFQFDPEQWILSYYQIKKNRQQLHGFFHSHPNGSLAPSLTDLHGLIAEPHATSWIISLDSSGAAVSVQVFHIDAKQHSPLMFTQISV